MDKRERFEIEYADQNNMRSEDFAQYRMGDTYRLPAIARAHRYFCAGWDANNSEQLAVAMNTMLYGTSAYTVDAGGFAGSVSPKDLWGGGVPSTRKKVPGEPRSILLGGLNPLSADPDTE